MYLTGLSIAHNREEIAEICLLWVRCSLRWDPTHGRHYLCWANRAHPGRVPPVEDGDCRCRFRLWMVIRLQCYVLSLVNMSVFVHEVCFSCNAFRWLFKLFWELTCSQHHISAPPWTKHSHSSNIAIANSEYKGNNNAITFIWKNMVQCSLLFQ